MKVLKNRMAKIAATGTPFESLKDKMTQTRALVFGNDPVGPAKVVTKFEKDNEKFKVVAGVLLTGTTPTVLDVNRVKAFATLPSRERGARQVRPGPGGGARPEGEVRLGGLQEFRYGFRGCPAPTTS